MFLRTKNKLELQSNPSLEDSYLVITIELVVGLSSACHVDDEVREAFARCSHVLTVGNHACVEVYPIRLVVI